MKKLIKAAGAAAGAASMIILAFSVFLNGLLPAQLSVAAGSGVTLNSSVSKFVAVEKVQSTALQAEANTQQGDYCVDMKLLGLVPIKTTQVKTQERQYVVPGGTPFGVKLYTAGVIVVGMTDVDTEAGAVNPARLAGIREGDAIISISGCQVNTTEDVAKAFENCDGNPIDVEVQRGGSVFMLKFTPALSASQKMYKAGLWVRDSSAGIGTMTFYDPVTGVFGGLGHGICDVDTGELMPLMSGAAVAVSITGCTPGRDGAPGELCGYFHNEKMIGGLKINAETGVYGRAKEPLSKNELLPVAMKQEISEGFAEIITTLDDSGPQKYEIEIVKIYYNSSTQQKNMVIKVTDPKLLEKTGGIVQGMSGSPIIQNGMLIGAVTHVFVNNSAQGYAIFAENMLRTAGDAA